MKIETHIKDAISLSYNETPRVSVIELDPESTAINVNFEDSSFRIDKTFETNIPVKDRRKNGPKKRLTQIFIGIPARDIHYEDLKEIFTIIFKACYSYKHSKSMQN